MVRGTFANVRLRNLLVPGSEGTWTVHVPSGEETTIFDASRRYLAEGTPLIVLAGKEYGTGSSRDWAAKGPLLLGVRAVIAETYERIHRSNLLMMGILPLQFLPGESRESLGPDRPRGVLDPRHRERRGARGDGARRRPRVPARRAPGHPARARVLPPRRHPPVRRAEARRVKSCAGSPCSRAQARRAGRSASAAWATAGASRVCATASRSASATAVANVSCEDPRRERARRALRWSSTSRRCQSTWLRSMPTAIRACARSATRSSVSTFRQFEPCPQRRRSSVVGALLRSSVKIRRLRSSPSSSSRYARIAATSSSTSTSLAFIPNSARVIMR